MIEETKDIRNLNMIEMKEIIILHKLPALKQDYECYSDERTKIYFIF